LQRLLPAGPAGACDPGRAAAPPARPPFWQTLRCLAWEKWPFFALTAVFCGLTYAIQQNSDAVVSLDHLGWNYRLANALSSYGRYLGKLVWPADLAVVYPYHRIDDWLQTGMIALVLALVSGFCLRQCRRRPWLTVGWFWYLITALPIIGLVQVGEASMADRYTYLPLIGPVLALVWLIPPTWWRTRFQRVLLGLGTAVGLSALALATRLQIQYWRDTVSLFTHAIAVTGDNPGAESGLGFGLEHEGRLDEALEHHRRARQLNPADRGNHLKVGQLLMQQQQWAEAADSLLTALALKPNDAATHEDLAAVLPHLGRYEETRQHWEAARQLAPADPGVLNNLAWLLATCPDPNLWDGPRAVSLAQRACELTRFQTTMFLGTLAAAQARAGRFDDATATARRACDLATAQGQAELLRRNQELLARYQQHQAWREPAGR
jgi:Flp pilus assembly protein TadD